jgi:hypothetical protein
LVFLRRQRILDRSQTADRFAHFHPFMAQPLILAELADLLFRLAHGSGRGQRLGDLLAVPLEAGSVAGVVWLSAVAVGFAAPEYGADDRAGPHVVELGQRLQEFGAAGFQAGERFRQGVPR